MHQLCTYCDHSMSAHACVERCVGVKNKSSMYWHRRRHRILLLIPIQQQHLQCQRLAFHSCICAIAREQLYATYNTTEVIYLHEMDTGSLWTASALLMRIRRHARIRYVDDQLDNIIRNKAYMYLSQFAPTNEKKKQNTETLPARYFVAELEYNFNVFRSDTDTVCSNQIECLHFVPKLLVVVIFLLTIDG